MPAIYIPAHGGTEWEITEEEDMDNEFENLANTYQLDLATNEEGQFIHERTAFAWCLFQDGWNACKGD